MKTLVIAEHDNQSVKPATRNTLGAAAAIGGEVHVLVAGSGCAAAAQAAAAIPGVAKVLVADAAQYGDHLAESLAALVTGLAFARFSRPTSRLLFSNVLVVQDY